MRSVELERLIALGLSLTRRRNAFAFAHGAIANIHWVQTGSRLNRATKTAAMAHPRDRPAAKKADAELLVPSGPRILFAGGQDDQDVDRISAVLNKVRAKHPGMVLLDGCSAKGADLIAAKWAENRKVPPVAVRQSRTRDGGAGPSGATPRGSTRGRSASCISPVTVSATPLLPRLRGGASRSGGVLGPELECFGPRRFACPLPTKQRAYAKVVSHLARDSDPLRAAFRL